MKHVVLAAALCLVAAGCYYTPKHSVSRPPPAHSTTLLAQSCLQTHEMCRVTCGRSYNQYDGRSVERDVQACVTACDDERDVCLSH